MPGCPWGSCPGTDAWAVSSTAGGRAGGFSEAQAGPRMKMLGADCLQGCYGFWRLRRGSRKVGMVAAWGVPRPPPVGAGGCPWKKGAPARGLWDPSDSFTARRFLLGRPTAVEKSARLSQSCYHIPCITSQLRALEQTSQTLMSDPPICGVKDVPIAVPGASWSHC